MFQPIVMIDLAKERMRWMEAQAERDRRTHATRRSRRFSAD